MLNNNEWLQQNALKRYVVYAKDRVEIKWKFRDEFQVAEKGENCSKRYGD